MRQMQKVREGGSHADAGPSLLLISGVNTATGCCDTSQLFPLHIKLCNNHAVNSAEIYIDFEISRYIKD